MRLSLHLSLALSMTLAWAGTAGAEPAPDPEDVLGEIIVEARGGERAPLRLPKIGVALEVPNRETMLAAEVIARDLELSHEFDVVPRPESGAEADEATRRAAWIQTGAASLVHVRAERAERGLVRFSVRVEGLSERPAPNFETTVDAPLHRLRSTSHQLADRIVGAYTGHPSAFHGQLAFVRTEKGRRTVYVIDPDGHNLRQVTSEDMLALSPVYAPDGTLHYAASFQHGPYRLYQGAGTDPIDLPIPGSVYGVAFSPAGDEVALSIAQGSRITLFQGPRDLSRLAPVSDLPLAMHPTYAPSGKLAWVGTAKATPRVYVGGRAVSPAGVPAAAPTFCDHPDGVRMVYAVGVRERSDLVAASQTGKDAVRLTKSAGRNIFPACSPDGRVVAFFSTRRSGRGPGLYLARVDGRRPPLKIASVVGDSMSWVRLPER